MLIKVILKNDEVTMRINGTLEDIAIYFFSNPDVVSIKILECKPFENEYYRSTPLEIYRVPEDEVKEFELWNNIRYRYKLEYLQGQAKDCITSSGLCNIA